jgi:hypothetical protein
MPPLKQGSSWLCDAGQLGLGLGLMSFLPTCAGIIILGNPCTHLSQTLIEVTLDICMP